MNYENELVFNYLTNKLNNSKIQEAQYDIILYSIQIHMIEKGTILKDIKLRNLGIDNLDYISDKLVDLNAVIAFLKSEIELLITDKQQLKDIFNKKISLPSLNDTEKEEIMQKTHKDLDLLKKEKEQLNTQMFDLLVNKQFNDFLEKKKIYEYIDWLITNL
jgi:hypothetical protein